MASRAKRVSKLEVFVVGLLLNTFGDMHELAGNSDLMERARIIPTGNRLRPFLIHRSGGRNLRTARLRAAQTLNLRRH